MSAQTRVPWPLYFILFSLPSQPLELFCFGDDWPIPAEMARYSPAALWRLS